jgi:hypothetical protein
VEQRNERPVLDLREIRQTTDPILTARREDGLILAARELERLARKMRALDDGKLSALTERDITAVRQCGISPAKSMPYARALRLARGILDALQAHTDEDDLLEAAAQELEQQAATLRSCDEVGATQQAHKLEEFAASYRQLSAWSAHEVVTKPNLDGESLRAWALRGARTVLDEARRVCRVH